MEDFDRINKIYKIRVISRRGAERRRAQRILGSCDFAHGIAESG